LDRLFKNPESLADTLGRGGFIVLNRNYNGNVPPTIEYGVFQYMPKAGERPEKDVLETALKDARDDISRMDQNRIELERAKGDAEENTSG